jgi:hypothetical protein
VTTARDEIVATLLNVADYLPTSTYEWPDDANVLRDAAASLAAVHAALDQFDILKGRRLFTAHETLAKAVAKAVDR